jgi:hypothetical protein
MLHQEHYMITRTIIPSFISASLVILLGCSFSTARIVEVAFATAVKSDHSPVVKIDRFYKHDPVLHCCVKMANSPSGTKVKAIWRHHSQEKGILPIDSSEIAIDNDGWVDFYFTVGKRGLPYGDYSVNLSVNGKFDRTAGFPVVRFLTDTPITDAVIASDVNEDYFPTKLQKEFSPDVKVIYAPIFVENAPEGSKFTSVWYQHFGMDEKKEIALSDFDGAGTGWIGFSLRPKAPLPNGAYSVDVMHNGRKHSSMSFHVK